MKLPTSKLFQSVLFFCAFLISAVATLPSLAHASRLGVLILAHGSHDHEKDHHHSEWERTVLETAGAATPRISGTVEVAFGMWERDSFQEGVDFLVSEGVDELRIVPLYISSHSILNQIQRYEFGLSLGFRHLFDWGRVRIPPSIRQLSFANALDDSIELSDILMDRAMELRQAPENEELVLVAHGPVTDAEDELWLSDLDVHARRIQAAAISESKPFAGVHFLTLRDDALPWTRDAMTRKLREEVQGIINRGRTPLILPVLMAPGGIEEGLLDRLKGLNFRYTGKMIAPHPRLVDWLVRESNRR